MANGTIYRNKATQKLAAQFTIDGKRKAIAQRKNETEKEFKKRFTQILNDINQGNYIESVNITFLDILKEHIDTKYKTNQVVGRTHLRDLETVKQIEKCCKDFVKLPIQKITVFHIKKALPNLIKYSNNTIDKIYRLINKTFKIAVSDRIINYNPMESESIKKPKSNKEDKKVTALTIEEHKKLIDVLEKNEHKYNNIILLQLYTGMRIGEVLALMNKDIDLKNNTITIRRTLTRDEHDKTIMGNTTKTENSKRTILINEKAKVILNKILKQQITNINGMLFYDNQKDTFITPNEINSYLKRLNEKEHIADNLHSHMLRHTFATRCIESGMQSKALQEILGHKKIQTTLDIYTSVFKEFNQVEVEKVNEYLSKQGI